MAAIRACKLMGTTRKRRKTSVSPELGSFSPKKTDKVTMQIIDELETLESLRTKSTNLNGKVSNQIKLAIINVRENVAVLAGKASENDNLRAKLVQLSEENQKLREKQTGRNSNNAENETETVNMSQEFQTPKSSSSVGVMENDLNVTMRKMNSQGGLSFTQLLEEEEPDVYRRNFVALPARKSYAESLYEARPLQKPMKPVGQNGVQKITEVRKPATPPPSIIRVRGNGVEYEQLVSKIKTGVNPVDYQITVMSLRKSVNQELELRVTGEEANIARFKEAISTCIGDGGSAKKVLPMAYVHISDLEADIAEKEIESDICKICNLEPEDAKVTSLRPAYGSAQKATVKIPKKAAEKLQEIGRVKIGYVSCRVQIREFDKRCFRCGENGHVAQNCKGPDRNGLCFRCGSKDHKIQGCSLRNGKNANVVAN